MTNLTLSQCEEIGKAGVDHEDGTRDRDLVGLPGWAVSMWFEKVKPCIESGLETIDGGETVNLGFHYRFGTPVVVTRLTQEECERYGLSPDFVDEGFVFEQQPYRGVVVSSGWCFGEAHDTLVTNECNEVV